MYSLKLAKFGNPILRQQAGQLTTVQIRSDEVQQLIRDLYGILDRRKNFGVGLAAPQMGVPLALAVISLKPTSYRPDAPEERLTIINPEIVAYYGRRTGMWEGCISFGTSANDFPYAQTRRYKKIRLRYMDDQGMQHEADFNGLLAHVIQHEADHLRGILFVDRVEDPKTYMLKSEYVRRFLRRSKH